MIIGVNFEQSYYSVCQERLRDFESFVIKLGDFNTQDLLMSPLSVNTECISILYWLDKVINILDWWSNDDAYLVFVFFWKTRLPLWAMQFYDPASVHIKCCSIWGGSGVWNFLWYGHRLGIRSEVTSIYLLPSLPAERQAQSRSLWRQGCGVLLSQV